MPTPEFLDVDLCILHLPPSRASGADPVKPMRQTAMYGASIQGMPPPWVYRGMDGALMIFDGVTRATRVAQHIPGTLIRVEVVGDLSVPCGHLPTIEDCLP